MVLPNIPTQYLVASIVEIKPDRLSLVGRAILGDVVEIENITELGTN
jgi:hypothetical protein